MKQRLLCLTLLLVFMFTAVVPAYAAPANAAPASGAPDTPAPTGHFLVENKSAETFNLTLSGAAAKQLTVKPGMNFFTLPDGKYQYSYTVCGVADKGTFELSEKKGGEQIVIKRCNDANKPGRKPAGGNASNKTAKTTELTIVNNTGSVVEVVLDGPQSYRYKIWGQKLTVTVPQGRYQTRSFGCGGKSLKFKLNLKSKTKTWTLDCNRKNPWWGSPR